MNNYRAEYLANHHEGVLSEPELIARIEALDQLAADQDQLQARMHPHIVELMQVRHQEYDVPDTLLDGARPIADQLYTEPTYNDYFVHRINDQGQGGDLDTRRGGDFDTAAHYEEGVYAKAILKAAQQLGFVAPELTGQAITPVDVRLGIAESYLEPIEDEVEAIIIPTAKGISNPMRIRDALRNIESGKIRTQKIIIASCDRPVLDDEKQRMQGYGFAHGETEFGSAIASFGELTGVDISVSDAEPFALEIAGVMREGKKLVQTVEFNDRSIELVVVSAPFDPTRQVGVKDGQPMLAQRANTQENFLAAYEFRSPNPGLLVIESHDVWVQGQDEAAKQILGTKGKRTIATGPYRDDRISLDDTGELVLNKPGEVVDEIAKTYSFATQTRVAILNEQTRLLQELDRRQGERINVRALEAAIPSMALSLEAKNGYRDIEINQADERFNEALVQLEDYGIAGQSYYSRSNATLEQPVPGVNEKPFLRRSVAQKLAAINEKLQNPKITEFFGGEVELYVEDGVRPVALQQQLFDVALPNLLRRNEPESTDQEIDQKKRTIIAAPSTDLQHPAPHATGGAVDVILRYRQDVKSFVRGVNVWIGHIDGDTADNIAPDYYEKHPPQDESDLLAQRNRRAFYAIMTGAAFNQPTNLAVNPTEIWHWSEGDQLWAALTKQIPYYGGVSEI